MSVTELSASTQNYLKAIWTLQEWSEEPVTPSLLAGKVGVRISSVSDALRKLTEQGLVEHTPYGSVSLTAAGRGHALAMVRRHRLIETFLVDVLGYRWDQVHEEAETLEHAVSDLMVERLDEHLGRPRSDPHGDPIPAADGRVHRPESILLTDLPPDTAAQVVRISDDDSSLLQHFEEHGLVVESRLRIQEAAAFSGDRDVLLEGAPGPLRLGTAATDAVRVRPLG